MKLKVQKIKVLPLLLVCMVLSTMFVLRAQNEVYSNNYSIQVNLSQMGFGDVFPGQEALKNFIVSYTGNGDGKYAITPKLKPKAGATVPNGYSGTIKDYCQENTTDYDRCYRNLCPYIDVVSSETAEGDTMDKATVSATDKSDVWNVTLKTPSILGKVTQGYNGSFVSETGEYGCDLKFDVSIPSAPECGNKIVEDGEECDDGNLISNDACSSTCKYNKGSISGCEFNDKDKNGKIDSGEGKMSGWEVQLVTCPYTPLSTGSATSYLAKSTINLNPTTGQMGYCSVKAKTTTGADGCYSFTNLGAGDYGVNEVNKSGWSQTVPASNTYYYFNLSAGENATGIDFLNHQEVTTCTNNSTIAKTPDKAYYTNSCNGTTDVLAMVKTAGDGKETCQSLSSGQTKYVYLRWYLDVPGDATITSATIKLRRHEDGIRVFLEGYNGSNWIQIEELNKYSESATYSRDVKNFVNSYGRETTEFRLKYAYPTKCHGCLDWAYLTVNYTKNVSCNVCGNSVIESGETCDDGGTVNGDGCSSTCKTEAASCGNGKIEGGEVCDDGNAVSGDGCSSCRIDGPVCGNSRLEAGELCDDGNHTNGDGCSSSCKFEDAVCGNGKLEASETCDDGNTANGDGCSASCARELTMCGNARLEYGESCDDGNDNDNDGCSSTCRIELPVCGNGRIETGETCDDGNTVKNDGCSNVCKVELPVCGNGRVETGEVCDDGNTLAGDGCTSCQIDMPACGNGKVEAGEVCDDGNRNNGDGCSSCCTVETPVCGNGKIEGYESCDDGNKNDGDGCSSSCRTECSVCGNGKVEGSETCDDGNRTNYDGCSNDCRIETPICGNGKVESGEGCDDGNTTSGDGCSSSCNTESHGCTNCGGCTKASITDVKVFDVTEVSAKFTWMTNKRADSRVVCGEVSIPNAKLKSKPSYGYDFSTSTYDISPKVSDHNVTVFELKPDTLYYCRTISSTSCGESKSTEVMFRTLKHKIIEPPIEITDLYIYDLTLQSVSQTCVDLKWKTNIKGTTCTIYGGSTHVLGAKPTYGYEWNTSRCWDTSKQYTTHAEKICGLNPCTTYYFRLTSTDGSQDAVTEEQQVRTQCQSTSTYYPTRYVSSVKTTETGKVAAAAIEKVECPTCEICDKATETIKTVIEKERYMTCEDWLILLLILIILILLINALVSRNRRRRDEEEIIPMGGVLTKRIDEKDGIIKEEVIIEDNKLD